VCALSPFFAPGIFMLPISERFKVLTAGVFSLILALGVARFA
jgi:hypothetical protein